jgi:anaerobic carbon-monoxide dehydrogenase iron sulfur subunit
VRLEKMEYKLVVNYEKCTGCGVCEIVCAIGHRLGLGTAESRVRVVALQGEAAVAYLPITCTQCEKAPCESVCPTRVISTASNGAKTVNNKKCIGCSWCVYVCPNGAIILGVSEKGAFVCDFCLGDPVCVAWCPNQAIEYVRSEELNIDQKRRRVIKIFDGQKLPRDVDEVEEDPYIRLLDSTNPIE